LGRTVRTRRLERFGPLDVRVPSEKEIAENPRRAIYVGGGWVDNINPSMINVYWHRRRDQFSVYSLLQVLEHETLHFAVHKIAGLHASIKLDNVHRSACIQIGEDRLIFVNEIKMNDWVLVEEFEDMPEDTVL